MKASPARSTGRSPGARSSRSRWAPRRGFRPGGSAGWPMAARCSTRSGGAQDVRLRHHHRHRRLVRCDRRRRAAKGAVPQYRHEPCQRHWRTAAGRRDESDHGRADQQFPARRVRHPAGDRRGFVRVCSAADCPSRRTVSRVGRLSQPQRRDRAGADRCGAGRDSAARR